MRRAHVAVILLTVLVLITACGTTPTNQWASARVSLTTAEKSILAAHTAGWITDQQLVNADVAVKGARDALDTAEAMLPEGGSAFDVLLAGVDGAIAQLEQLAAEAAAREPVSPGMVGPPDGFTFTETRELRERHDRLLVAFKE